MNEENLDGLLADNPFELRTERSGQLSEDEIRSALESGEIGFLHSFTTGSAVDGPGIRVVAWTTGCQFRCIYCHNPDTWKIRNGTPVTIRRAVDELEKYSRGLRIMSGGFTLSGGEPLMQDRFAVRLFAEAKKRGIHTALDTNGSLGQRLSDHELSFIDLVLLDIKSWFADNHRKITGQDNDRVIEFAERLAKNKKNVWIRFVLVPGYTDNPDEIERIASFAAGLGNVERIDVLPFHQMGRYKWKEVGLQYCLEEVIPPSESKIEEACLIFRKKGMKSF